MFTSPSKLKAERVLWTQWLKVHSLLPDLAMSTVVLTDTWNIIWNISPMILSEGIPSIHWMQEWLGTSTQINGATQHWHSLCICIPGSGHVNTMSWAKQKTMWQKKYFQGLICVYHLLYSWLTDKNNSISLIIKYY